MSNFTLASTAYTSVESPRRTLDSMPVAAHPAEARNPQKWPETVKEYVRRSFDPDNKIDGIERNEMEKQLKETITYFYERTPQGGDTVDWSTLPLPQQIIQQKKAAYHTYQQTVDPGWNPPLISHAHIAFTSASTTNGDLFSHNKKRPFDEQSSSLSNLPPWRKTSKNGALEDRITHTPKHQTTRAEKKLKKSQAMEPSSKFQEALDVRRRRFNLDNSPKSNAQAWSGHDEYQAPVLTGHVVGTSQEVFKNYFRLTRAPFAAEVRPQPILEQALSGLKQRWRQDSNYNYICDQLKSIRQDLTVQHIKNAFTVEVYQTHALIALEKGDLGEYNQCQTQLRDLYAKKLGGRPAEFTAYRILYIIHTNNRASLNEILVELTPADKIKPAIRHALGVRSAVASGNYHKLFKLYLDCPNMGAYLMDMFVARERIFALAKMCKGYKTQKLSIKFLAEELGFESYEDAHQFLEINLCSEEETSSPYLLNLESGIVLDANAALHFEALRKKYERIDIKGQI